MGTFDVLGFNLRLSDIQAAIGVAQLDKLDRLLTERRERAHRYHTLLTDIHDIALPQGPQHCGHTYQSYVIRVLEGGTTRRNALMDVLDASGIQTRPGTHAVHRLGYYRDKYRLKPERFPAACAAEDLSITLPIFPGMRDDQQERIAEVLRSALRHGLSPSKAA
jgi:dTDP-4-amino-4,6-dideoxygalactose transaminase